MNDLTNPDSPAVIDAKSRSCDICKAKVGCLCTNTIDPDQPIPYRLVHFGRCIDRRKETKADE